MSILLLLSLLALGGCAATTPPPRFAPVGPADVDGPESATLPASPTLTTEPEALAAPPEAGHEEHHAPTGHEHAEHAPASSDAATPAVESYTCTMHPEVSATEPGRCPKCGMPLVKRPGAERKQ